MLGEGSLAASWGRDKASEVGRLSFASFFAFWRTCQLAMAFPNYHLTHPLILPHLPSSRVEGGWRPLISTSVWSDYFLINKAAVERMEGAGGN